MRAAIFVIILAALAVLVAIATGLLHINQLRGGKAPQVRATPGGVSAQGGEAPSFEVETGSVRVGTRSATVKVPDIRVQPADPAPVNNSVAGTGNQD